MDGEDRACKSLQADLPAKQKTQSQIHAPTYIPVASKFKFKKRGSPTADIYVVYSIGRV